MRCAARRLIALLALARRYCRWIIADETCARFRYGKPARAVVFQRDGCRGAHLFVNTFSKSWAMTGWRIGWLPRTPRSVK
jgi:aspartate/methionine/tyrosine aminotransferase